MGRERSASFLCVPAILMATVYKKVLVRRYTGDILAGYLALSGFIRHDPPLPPTLDLLDLSGRIIQLSLDSVKMVSYVRDFNLSDSINPERIGRRFFLARPRAEGLWLRLTLVGGDTLEGLADADLSFLIHAVEDHGLSLTPPDTRSNTQRIFLPRAAIEELQVLAVVTTPSRKKIREIADTGLVQDSLFSTIGSS